MKNRFKSPREELDFYRYQDLSSRAAKTSAGKPVQSSGLDEMKKVGEAVTQAVKSLADKSDPVITVKMDSPIPAQVRKWTFKHKYDMGKLVETTATAE